ncbi:MAG: enoyl-CoA hydratase/isomerase family protein [Deltaproteobacteria bacterium]|nr:enoyl-CoA hydratase/isomerase family protein [Deltaproteobacteria bacterium]
MSDESALIVYTEGPVWHIRFNRPEKLNAIDTEQHERVIRAVQAADYDPAVRVIAFSGEGRAFCSGDDIKTAQRRWPERHKKRLVDLDIGVGPLILQEATTVIRDVCKPTVVLMHGYALGAGYDYATSCDFRVATEDCQFGDPRVHRALWAAEGWSYKLLRLIGGGWATKIALLGEPLTGVEAEGIGLVHRVYPPDADLRESAREFLLKLASLPAESYAVIKRHILDGMDLSYQAALAHQPR